MTRLHGDTVAWHLQVLEPTTPVTGGGDLFAERGLTDTGTMI